MSLSRREQFEAARSEPDQLARLIEKAIAEGAAKEAVEWSEHLSRIDPDRVRRYLLNARTLGAAGQFSRSDKVIQRYEQLYGEDAPSLTTQAEIALLRNLSARAENLLERALELDPENRRAVELLLLAAERDPARANDILSKVAAAGSRLASIERGSRFLSELQYDEAADLFAAVLQRSPDPSTLEEISYLLVQAGLHDRAIELVLPHLSAESKGAAINLLHAFVRLGRFDDATLLLERYRSADDEKLDFLGSVITAKTLRPSKATPLLDLIATSGRLETSRSRDRLFRKLIVAELLLAVELPLSRDPAAVIPLRGLVPIRRTTGALTTTLLAFTHHEAARAWNDDARWTTVPARQIFHYAVELGDVEVTINAAGPSSMTLHQTELAALARTEIPRVSEEEVALRPPFYIFEPGAGQPPVSLVQRLRDDLAEYPEITEAYLVQIVNERVGRSYAVGVVFQEATPKPLRKDLLFDLMDPSRHSERESRVHFFAVDDRLLTEVRRGFWLIEAIRDH